MVVKQAKTKRKVKEEIEKSELKSVLFSYDKLPDLPQHKSPVQKHKGKYSERNSPDKDLTNINEAHNESLIKSIIIIRASIR